MQLDLAALNQLSEQERKQLAPLLEQLRDLHERNPLWTFKPNSDKQEAFLAAQTRVQAAFAGNRFGKTTALTVKAFIQHMPDELIPSHLLKYRRPRPHDWPVVGRLVCPSAKVMEGVTIPAMRKWAPRDILLGGDFDKAWDKQNKVLRMEDGGRLEVFTYEQDADKFVGASCDYIGYDEPPPEEIRNENLTRLVDREGFEMYALTPVNMSGGGIGWLYRKIWRKRDLPHVTVIKGSIWDNSLLSRDAIEATLAEFPAEERQAREHGDFLHFGGMIYPGGFEHVLRDPPTPDELKNMDIVLGIDPGLKNAAFVWIAFDNDNRAFVFDCALLHEQTPVEYGSLIRRTNAKWGVRPLNVIDPSARNRSLVNAESLQAELERQGIFCIHGQNEVQAGVQQVRRRLREKGLFVSSDPALQALRLEADEYRMEDTPDGEFKVVKENDHLLDALRYACMSRPWYPLPIPAWERRYPRGVAPPAAWFDRPEEDSLF